MKKIIGLLIILLIFTQAKAQPYNYPIVWGIKYDRFAVVKSLIVPVGNTATVNTNLDSTGSIFYRTSDSTLVVHTGHQFIPVIRAVKYSDTASMLAGYVRRTELKDSTTVIRSVLNKNNLNDIAKFLNKE